MKKLAICVLGLCLTMPYAFSVQSTHDAVRGEGQSWLMAENLNAPAMATATGHTKTISNGRYIGGGVASIFLGFGIGHAIQGRWGERGWTFTLLDTIGVSGMIASSVALRDDIREGVLIGGFVGSILIFVTSKIWSIADAWVLPSQYKIAQESRFQVNPLIVSNYSDLSTVGLGLGMKYRF